MTDHALENFPGRWVKVMADVCALPVWDRDGMGAASHALPISLDLMNQLDDWADRASSDGELPLSARDHPAVLNEAFAMEGLTLARRLADELPDWTIVYLDDAKAGLASPDWSIHECQVSAGQPLPSSTAWRMDRHASLPSTSDLCLARAATGEPGGLAVQAFQQTAGRGSRGRHWTSMDGNLALSVLVRPAGDAADAGRWALASAVALRAGLANFTDGLTIKWPNDILRDGRKVAGLLVDAATEGSDLSWVVLGMGANLRTAPAPSDGEVPAASLGPHDSADVADCVLDRLSTVLRVWRDDGFEAVRRIWLRHAHPIGTPLSVRSPRHDVSGTFAGLSPDGALLLQTHDGLRAFSTGEVLLGC